MKLRDIKLPNYTTGEEIFNAVTHGVGIIFAFISLVIGLCYANTLKEVVAVSIYGASMLLLFSMSTLYHGLKDDNKRLFRLFDHCSIFLLIAGTYTPYTLLTLSGAKGWTIFGIVWGIALFGIAINIADIKKFSKISMTCYLVSGWVIIVFFPTLLNHLELPGFLLLLGGGVAYTIGAVIYGFGKKVRYFHSIWHLFILLGCVLQYFSILLFVL